MSEPDADSSADVHALSDYSSFIRQLLVDGHYDTLDCIADSARANKTKLPGGFWKIHTIYAGLSKPVDSEAHATEDDWKDHIDRLKSWMSAKPNSVTARIALAQTYIGYAWEARGEGSVNTVTGNGWKLVGERTQAAEELLKEAQKLPTKCPEWYLTVQELLQLQGTDKDELAALLKDAVAFEPTYQYFYRLHANLIASKWYGDDGDEEKFIGEAADHVGGTQGDILYFQIASTAICACNDGLDLKLLSWPRMQKGYSELTKQSGPSMVSMNLLANVAIRELDATVADQAFTKIGDNWDPDLWKTKPFFDSNKKWAADGAAYNAWQKARQDAAEADMRSPEGLAIKNDFDEKFAARIQACVNSSPTNERTPFSIYVVLGENGEMRQYMAMPATQVSDCIIKQGPEKLLAPPHPAFMLKIDVDPSKVMTASARVKEPK